jgi:O-antigen/teichoic acid export membrane protein
VVYAGSRWAMVAVLAKFGTPEAVGEYALGLAVAQPIMVLAMLSLRNVQATDARRDHQFGDYLGLRLATTLAALAAIVGVAMLGDYRWETRIVVVCMGISCALDAVVDVYYGMLQQRNRMDRVAQSMAMRGLFSLVGLAVGVSLTGNLVYGILGSIAASMLILVGFDIVNAIVVLRASRVEGVRGEGSWPRWEWVTLLKLVGLSLPLGVTSMLVALQANVPRYFIVSELGERALGIFAATASVLTIGRTFLTALEDPAVPRLARHYLCGERRAFLALFGKLLALDAVVGGGMLLVGIVAGRPFLTLLYTAEYAEETTLILWLLAGGGIGYLAMTFSVGLYAARFFKIHPPLTACGLGVTALTCWILIPTYGLHGAAIAALITMVVLLLLYCVCFLYALRVMPERR